MMGWWYRWMVIECDSCGQVRRCVPHVRTNEDEAILHEMDHALADEPAEVWSAWTEQASG